MSQARKLLLFAIVLGSVVDARNIRRFSLRRNLSGLEHTTAHGINPLLHPVSPAGGVLRKRDLECRLVHKKKYKDKCQFIRDNCADEEVGIFDYLQLYYCKLPNSPLLAISILGGWLAMLFMTIGIAASDFFCPNLATISKIMGMSESVAGVTFLALGNGSPDVFSTFAAMKIDSASLAIGELVGAASFITAVVAGSMAIVKPFKVSRRSFIRDISFFIAAIVFGVIFLTDGRIGLLEGIVMICFYVFYVLFVIGSQWYYRMRRRRRQAEHTARMHYADTDGERPILDDDEDRGGEEDGLLGDGDFNALENGQTDDFDDDDEELQEQQRYSEVTRNLSKQIPGRPRMERQYTGAIRPSLATAMEFRAVIHSLAKSKNQIGGPFPLSRYEDNPNILRRNNSAPHPLERRRSDPVHENAPNQDNVAATNGRNRAVSVNDAQLPHLEFGEYQSALSTVTDNSGAPTPSHSPKFTIQQPPPDVVVDLASPTGTQPTPQLGLAQSMARVLGEETQLYLSPPSSRGVSPSPSSGRSSPMLRPTSPSHKGLTSLTIPEPHSPTFHSPSAYSDEAPLLTEVAPDSIPDLSRRGSDATYLSHIESVKRKVYQWWPYNVLPAPHEITDTLFPTLCGFIKKTHMERLFAIITAPSIFILTLTLPVYEMARDEAEAIEVTSALPSVMIDSPTSSHISYAVGMGGGAVDESMLPNSWARWLAGIQCILAPLFVIFMVFGEEGSILKPVLWGLLGGLIGLMILLTTTSSHKPPKFRYIFCFIGFVVGITWISTIANEVVGVLKAFGVIFGISDAILGLTVFAVGNSLGDLVANITIAKLGFPVMALAACFGGPLLNILLGIGGSGLYLTITNPEKPLKFDVSATLIVSGATLLLTLFILLVFVPINQWRMSRRVGFTLIGLWVASTVVNLALELTGRSHSLLS